MGGWIICVAFVLMLAVALCGSRLRKALWIFVGFVEAFVLVCIIWRWAVGC